MFRRDCSIHGLLSRTHLLIPPHDSYSTSGEFHAGATENARSLLVEDLGGITLFRSMAVSSSGTISPPDMSFSAVCRCWSCMVPDFRPHVEIGSDPMNGMLPSTLRGVPPCVIHREHGLLAVVTRNPGGAGGIFGSVSDTVQRKQECSVLPSHHVGIRASAVEASLIRPTECVQDGERQGVLI